jgi:phytoene desaturase
MSKALVVGAGIAGLAVALRLRKKGYTVAVFESNAYPGGKLHEFSLGPYRFDWGPSLFTMPHLVTELFELFNEQASEHFNYIKKDHSCFYFWEDGTSFNASTNPDLFAENLVSNFGENKVAVENYLQKNKKKYDLTAKLFLESSLHKLKTYISKDTLKALINFKKLDLYGTLNDVNTTSFNNPKIVQLFNRYATYNGSNPYKTPGIMSMIPHLEMDMGTYFPEGGMHNITKSLYKLAVSQGVQFYFEERVENIAITNGKATGINTKVGYYPADVVVTNADIAATYKDLLVAQKEPKRTLNQEKSSSAIIFYWGIARSFPELDLHNIFFSSDYQKEFNAIFNEKKPPEDPTVYINISSKNSSMDAPKGCENWFVMVNAPSASGQDWATIKSRLRKKVIEKTNKILGTDIEKYIVEEDSLDPLQIEKKTGSVGGALYGASSNSKFAAFLRHPNFSSHISGLYFCGGSVHPGGGIPLCLLSAKITSDLIPDAPIHGT